MARSRSHAHALEGVQLEPRVCLAPSSDAVAEGADQPFCLVRVTYQARNAGALYVEVIAPARLAPAHHIDEPAQDRVAVETEAVVLELVGDPRLETADSIRRLACELLDYVRIVEVDRCRDGHFVVSENVRVIQPRPIALSEQLRSFLVRPEGAVVIKHPRKNVLACQPAVLFEFGGVQSR